MNKWNELCYILFENLPSNTNEQLFELKVVQAFEKLGWSEFNNEIIIRESIQLGASNRISPDLVIKSEEGENLFIVEVKRPSLEIDNSNYKGQLSSYMGIMRVDIGILIGNKIQLYIDGKFFNKNEIILIEEIEFKRDCEKGLRFVQLFDKKNYNKKNIEQIAIEQQQIEIEIADFKKLKDEMVSEVLIEKIKNYLKSEFLKTYKEITIDKVFNVLELKIESKNKIIEKEIIKKRSKDNIRHKSLATSNESNTNLKIGKFVKKTFAELLKDNLLDSIEIERLQRSDYSKSTFDIQFPFLAKKDSKHYIRERYWKEEYKINGELFYLCSQWYEVQVNNDRPYYEKWLKNIKQKYRNENL